MTPVPPRLLFKKSLARNDAHVFAPKRNFIAKFLPSAQGAKYEFIPALL
jgi:hypothetical protein